MTLKAPPKLVILAIFLLATAPAFSQSGRPAEPRPPVCKKELTRSFGFSGLEKPIEGRLVMCPDVTHSCCSTFDQIALYENWEFNHEHALLRERFTYLRDVYTTALNTALHTDALARNLLDLFAATTVTNCKVYAKRVTHYHIADVAPKLYTAIATFYDWWEAIYSGFYCLVCDADAHPYFDLKGQKVEYGVKFCRNLVMTNLPVLLYLNIHMPKYMNAIIQYTSSCSKNGAFVEDAFAQSDLFTVDLVLKKKIEKCRDFRNHEDWYDYCKFLCDEFNMVDFNKRFEPMIQKYYEANTLIRANLERYEGRTHPQAPHKDGSHGRVLQDQGVGHEGSSDEAAHEKRPVNLTLDFWDVPAVNQSNITDGRRIIRAADNGDIPFDTFEDVWTEDGLMPDKHAHSVEMTHAKYQKLYKEKLAADNGAGKFGAGFAMVLLWLVGSSSF